MKSLSAAALLFLSGCMVGPNYKPPETTVPAEFSRASTQPSTQLSTQPGEELNSWWKTFDDATLDGLIDRAVESNLDLKLASERVREARAARGIPAADLLPTVDGAGFYEHNRRSLNGSQGGFGQREGDLYDAGFDASWEIDVFGGVRREIESADAIIGASIENRRDVLVTLLAEVARNYIELRGRQAQLTITRDNLKSQQETLELTRSLSKGGLSNDLDVARASALVETTDSQIPLFEQAVEQSIHRLGVLLGADPVSLKSELTAAAAIPQGVRVIPTGTPSDLLRRRPDIRRAERQIASFNAQIGVATADLFPRFSLTGSFGLQAQHFNDLGDSNSIFYGVGPGVRWTILDWGRIRSRIDVADSQTKQAFLAYQQTVLAALEETENALVAFEKQKVRRQSLSNAVASNRRAVELANQLFTRGLIDYLSVQEAQRNLLLSEDLLAQSDIAVSSSLVALYKALGGGWEAEPTPTPHPSPQ